MHLPKCFTASGFSSKALRLASLAHQIQIEQGVFFIYHPDQPGHDLYHDLRMFRHKPGMCGSTRT